MGNLNLETILNLQSWNELQDSFSLLTNFAILTVNYKGEALTTHSNCSEFCAQIRKDPKLSKLCRKCDSRGGLESVRLNRPYLYLCHLGVIEIAIPIHVDDKYLGAILAGQVRLHQTEPPEELERVAFSPNDFEAVASCKHLMSLYEQMPLCDWSHVLKTADTLYTLSNYMLGEAARRKAITDAQGMVKQQSLDTMNDEFKNLSLENLMQIQNELSNMVIDQYLDKGHDQGPLIQNNTLCPAIVYLYQHKNELLTASQAAKLCHISTSYFSRLFAKEAGENYSTYVTRLKIDWAKQLLSNTDISIAQISDELGFSDASYFVKQFKKLEQLTPAIYRKYHHGVSSAPAVVASDSPQQTNHRESHSGRFD